MTLKKFVKVAALRSHRGFCNACRDNEFCPILDKMSHDEKQEAFSVGITDCFLYRCKKNNYKKKVDQHKRFISNVKKLAERL